MIVLNKAIDENHISKPFFNYNKPGTICVMLFRVICQQTDVPIYLITALMLTGFKYSTN